MAEKKTNILSRNISDMLKGIAIIMVTFSHYAEWGKDYFISPKLAEFIASLGDYGVGIFFLLSGYGLYIAYGDKKTDVRYLLIRIIKIYIPYLLIASFIAIYGGGIEGIKDIFRLLTGADYWFMITIFILYLSFYVFGKLPKISVLLESIFVAALSLFFYFRGFQVFWYSATWTFALGMILALLERKFIKKAKSIDFGEVLFAFAGKNSLYVYMLHTFLFWQIMSIPFVWESEIPWEIKSLIILIITILVAFVIRFLYDLLTKPLIKKVRLGEKNEKDS